MTVESVTITVTPEQIEKLVTLSIQNDSDKMRLLDVCDDCRAGV